MPHIVVKLYPGRSEEQKTALTDKIVKAVVEEIKCDVSAVSVSFEETPKDRWAKEVYKPDIMNKPECLYKKPGYKPPDEDFI
jgi:4-oxalocrotonate tautomerase